LRWLWRAQPVKGVWRWDDPLPLPLRDMAAIRAKGAALGSPANHVD